MDVGSDNFRFTLDDPEKKARTIKQPMCAELHISSLDRYYGYAAISQIENQLFSGNYTLSSTDCIINSRGRAMLYGYYNRLAITELQLFLRVPTIIKDYNDKFAMRVNTGNPATSGTDIYTVPPGYYTPETLAATLQTFIRTTPGSHLTDPTVFTVQAPPIPFGKIYNGFLFSTNDYDTIDFIDINTIPPITGQPTLVGWKFYRLIGADKVVSYTSDPTFTATQIILTSTPNWLPTDYIDIVSSALTNYKAVKDTNSNEQAPQGVIARVYLTDNLLNAQSTTDSFTESNPIGAAPILFTKKWAVPNWSKWSPNQTINQLDFKFLDMWGAPLFWSNSINAAANTEWEMTLVVSD